MLLRSLTWRYVFEKAIGEKMKILFSLLLILLIQGCASSLYKKITNEELERVRSNSSVIVKYYRAPSFYMMTPKEVGGQGWIADLTGSSDLPIGSALVNKYKIQDPTVLLANETASLFKSKRINIIKIDSNSLPLPVKEETNYSNNSDYILEFNTPAWLANYLTLNWRTYAFVVRGAGRLIRTSDQVIVWKGYCFHGGYEDDRFHQPNVA